ncbi:MAG: GNAT family N-acetyltransferase, partial [Bacteroidota bacterium]
MIRRTDSEDSDFIELVGRLDADLALRDGEDHSFYAQFNKITGIKYCLVLLVDGKPAGCGAIRPLNGYTVEIKRMYTVPAMRGKGFATR